MAKRTRADRDMARMSSRSPGPHQPTPPVHRGGGTSSPAIDTGGTAGGPGPEAASVPKPKHGVRTVPKGILVAGAAGLGIGGYMMARRRGRGAGVSKVLDPVTGQEYLIEKAAHSGTTGKAPGQFAHHERNLYGAPQGAGGRGRGRAHVYEAAGRHGSGGHQAHVLGSVHPGTSSRRVRPLTPAGPHVQRHNDLDATIRRGRRGGSQSALAVYHSGSEQRMSGGGARFGHQASHVRKSLGFQSEGMPSFGTRGTPMSAFGNVSRVGRRLPA